jgi:hypothetical protein
MRFVRTVVAALQVVGPARDLAHVRRWVSAGAIAVAIATAVLLASIVAVALGLT